MLPHSFKFVYCITDLLHLSVVLLCSHSRPKVADAAASKVTALDESIAARLAKLPNLLADGVPSGLSENDNEQVLEWGTEARKMGDGYKWHDEIAAGFNGYERDT